MRFWLPLPTQSGDSGAVVRQKTRHSHWGDGSRYGGGAVRCAPNVHLADQELRLEGVTLCTEWSRVPVRTLGPAVQRRTCQGETH